MRIAIRPLVVALIAALIVGPHACAQLAVEQWAIDGTAPVRVTLPAEDAPLSVWARAGDGSWTRIAPDVRDGRLMLQLTARQLAGGSALVVLDPPAWLSLEDAGPPKVELFAVDGADITGRQSIDLGWLNEMPGVIVLRVRDEDNPLDRGSIHVRTPAGVFTPRAEGVDFAPEGVRGGTLTVRPRELEGLEMVTRASVELVIDDYAIDDEQTRRSVSWSLSPRIRLDDGSLLLVSSVTSEARWSDWSVVADGEIMTEADGTTAGMTWMSDNSTEEHWLRWQFPERREVVGVELAWPWYQTWRTSRHYDVQTWDGERWVTQLEVRDQTERQISEHRFEEPVSTGGVRLLQHPMGGQIERQDLMWLANAEVLYAE
ncbi:MAG: hypothetical protein ACOX9R_19605 [Armatimonadota bacterium]|jgi:hypothetical protein